jgi:rhamnulokinase
MRPLHCAAVDLGATSGRVIVGTWHGRRLRLTEVRRFPNQFRNLAGHDYWDLPYLWDEVRAGLVEAKRRFPSLASVGVDSWAVDHVLVNAKGSPVHPTYAYRDGRTRELSEALGRRGLGKIYALTGIPNYPYNTSLQLQATIASFPRIADCVSRCLFVSDYFNFLLSGRMENELSICSHSQLIAVDGRSWCGEALDHFGIPRGWFRTPCLSPAEMGPVTGLSGFKSVKSVLVPGHDTACAFAAMPAAADGSDLYLSSGTWSLMGFEEAEPVLGKRALEARISNERMGDGRYRPLRSSLGLWLVERTLASFKKRRFSGREWARLAASAGRLTGPGRLLDLTDSSLFNPPDMRTAIDAQLARRAVGAPKDLTGYIRLIVSSIGFAHAQSKATFERLTGKSFGRVLIVGGGSKNALLCQATADACGIPVVSYSLEGTAVGNIASQLLALGEIPSLASFRADIARSHKSRAYAPR